MCLPFSQPPREHAIRDDDFDNIRAEREMPYRPAPSSANKYPGLWKQIALGIVVGHLSLGLIGFVLWLIATHFFMGNLQLSVP